MTLQSRWSERFIPGSVALLVVMCMLVSQALGLVHGLAHSPHYVHGGEPRMQAGQHGGKHADGAGVVASKSGDHNEAAQSSLSPLFSSHGSDADCRLFDQACHGSTVRSLPLVMLPVLNPLRAIDISRSAALARWAALFNARGPPLSR